MSMDSSRARLKMRSVILLAVTFIVMVVGFQNCAGGSADDSFKSENNGNGDSYGGGGTVDTTETCDSLTGTSQSADPADCEQ